MALNARAWECGEGVLALQAAANGGAEEQQRRTGGVDAELAARAWRGRAWRGCVRAAASGRAVCGGAARERWRSSGAGD